VVHKGLQLLIGIVLPFLTLALLALLVDCSRLFAFMSKCSITQTSLKKTPFDDGIDRAGLALGLQHQNVAEVTSISSLQIKACR
jgi:hypothetical protein